MNIKVTIHINGLKKTQNTSSGQSDKCASNFMHSDHQNNTLPRSQESFQTNFSIYLRNSGIKKQSDKRAI